METEWVADRIQLYQLMRAQPDWSVPRLAAALGYSESWVKKWRRRFRAALTVTLATFLSRSRAPKTRPRRVSPPVIDAILTLRDHLKAVYHRAVGATTIRYYLQQDERLRQQGHYLPRSAHTIGAILKAAGRIPQRIRRLHSPLVRPQPLTEWEFDFGLVKLQPDRWLEFFIAVDRGTSILVDTQTSDGYQADTALLAVAQLLLRNGLPQRLRFDRDPRLVGSWTTDGYPSAFVRFVLCLGITPDICPPRRPDLKPFVERAIRTVKYECLYPQRPTTVEQADPLLADYRDFYNAERPNQAVSCNDRPPYTAFPDVPVLPSPPETVNPDAWLESYHGRVFRRRVSASGSVMVDKYAYYLGQAYAGQRVSLHLDAQERTLYVLHQGRRVKTLPLQGLYNGQLAFQDYLNRMLEEARSLERYLRAKTPQYATV